MPADRDEFYVGYAERSPPGIASRVRVVAVILVAAAALLAAALTLGQSRFDPGVFEFGVDREWTGVVSARPYPVLRVPDASGRTFESYTLVGFGKFGADSEVAGLDGRAARVTGSLIRNAQRSMIEVHAVAAIDGPEADRMVSAGRAAIHELGRMTLVGEIVDSKCHLGVMKPGRGKTHRACAVRCVSGGIPPVLRIEDERGNVDYLMLVDAAGGSVNERVLGLIAEPVEISGRVVRMDDLLVLYADPATYRRL